MLSIWLKCSRVPILTPPTSWLPVAGLQFFSSLSFLLSSLPLYGGPLSGSLHVLDKETCKRLLSSLGVFSQSCPEVAWVVYVALRSRVSCTFKGGSIYLSYVPLLPRGYMFDDNFSEFVWLLQDFRHFSKPWCQTFLQIKICAWKRLSVRRVSKPGLTKMKIHEANGLPLN